METEIDGDKKKKGKEKTAVSTLMAMSPMRRMRRGHEDQFLGSSTVGDRCFVEMFGRNMPQNLF
jgi:hypothetical protein